MAKLKRSDEPIPEKFAPMEMPKVRPRINLALEPMPNSSRTFSVPMPADREAKNTDSRVASARDSPKKEMK